MEWFVILGALAAFGCVCALWALLGWLLPGGKGSAAVCVLTPGLGELSAVRRLVWLRDWGFLKGPILLVDCGLSEEERQALAARWPDLEVCNLEALAARLELERNGFDGTGNGNHPGRDQRRGVSEL